MWKGLDEKHDYGGNHQFVPVLINHLGGIRYAVEVGVEGGILSAAVLKSCPSIEEYFLIDPWATYPERLRGTKWWDKRSPPEWDKQYEKAMERIKPYKDKVRVRRHTSVDAVSLFRINSLDFVFIDAIHDFNHVNQDIRSWWPKLRATGYLTGHDLRDYFPGVQAAVELNFGNRYHRGDPWNNWGHCWIVSKEEFGSCLRSGGA